MMKPRSAKNKGQAFQKDIVRTLRDKYNLDPEEPTDFEGDIAARMMGGSGVDIILSPLAKKQIPFDIECKRTERTNIWQWIEQAETNTKPDRIPLVVFRRNRSNTYCCLKFDDLLSLLKPNDKLLND